jgi:glycosyltransferase involved in cell wall biosynthesis
MRLLIVQYAGDYREAYRRLLGGGHETYYAQRYSVESVAEIGKEIGEAATLTCITDERYNELLEEGVRAIGGGFKGEVDPKILLGIISEYNPTHLVVRTLIRDIFRWSIRNKIPTLTLITESVPSRTIRDRLRNHLLVRLLNNPNIHWVGVYGLNSALLFQKIGVNPDKIIPWNFVSTERPDIREPRNLGGDRGTWQLLYIGSVIDSKGVGDLLQALAYLKSEGFPAALKIVGEDGGGIFHNRAKKLGIEGSVEFMGLIPNSSVVSLMREVDVVVVPSHHEFPEAFPLVITHSLCARTPVIVSDHPMFLSNLKHRINAMIFPAKDPSALSECIKEILSDPELYRKLSVNSHETWLKMQIPVKFADLMRLWVHDSPEDREWLYRHRLSSGIY